MGKKDQQAKKTCLGFNRAGKDITKSRKRQDRERVSHPMEEFMQAAERAGLVVSEAHGGVWRFCQKGDDGEYRDVFTVVNKNVKKPRNAQDLMKKHAEYMGEPT